MGRVVRRATPPPRARWAASLHGWRDGRHGLPHVPPPPAPSEPRAVTPYISEQRATARRAIEQLRARLMYRERHLVTEIRRRAAHVVAEYDHRGRPAPAALAGFGERVGEWRAQVDVCRYRATAVTEQINQQIARYWDAVRRNHRDVPDPPPAYLEHWGPAPLLLDASWEHPDSWLCPPGTEVPTALARALELLDRTRTVPTTARKER
ncbi:hypothetical protein [Streptomyces sp. B6B3]|uniref:hypothetical protein n=1 Tax=Streptomyces sp. B6B3 TaxID=3153570 RepID=UPI00325C48B7